MGSDVLKNWKPREIVSFLKKKGFVETKKRKKGDHCCLVNRETGAYTEVDMGRGSFYVREMLSFVKQSGISKEDWLDA